MVGTRSKNVDYIPDSSSYGREAKASRRRRRQRAKYEKQLSSASPRQNTRARINDVEDALQSTPEKDTSLTSPSILPRTLRSSHCRPTCSNYGLSRHSRYRNGHGYYFCHPCDLWDKEQDVTNRISRVGTMLKCKANHKSFVFPTDTNLPIASSRKNLNLVRRALFVKAMRKFKDKKKNPINDHSDTVSDSSHDELNNRSVSVVDSPLLMLDEGQEVPQPIPYSSPEKCVKETAQKEIRRLTDQIQKLQQHLDTALEQNTILQSKIAANSNLPVDDGGSPGETQNKRFQETMISAVEDCVKKDLRFNRWGVKRLGEQLTKAFFLCLMVLPRRPY